MKKTINLFLALCIGVIIFSCNGNNEKNINSSGTVAIQSGSPEEIADKLIRIISENNYTELVEITLTKQQRDSIISKSNLDKKTKNELSSKTDTEMKDILSRSKKNFDDVIRGIENNGVLIKDIKYKNCDYRLNKRKGVYSLDLYITFDFKGNEYGISSEGLLKDGDNWRFTGDLSYTKQYSQDEKAMMEERAKFMQDSIAAAINASMEEATR